ncbi:MAG: hypothetical protein WD066_13445 [Planctomycetaceae bacterium]
MAGSTDVLRWFESQGDLFAEAYGAYPQYLPRIRHDRYFGLAWFLHGFAFAKSGAPRGFPIAAVKALRTLQQAGEDLSGLKEGFMRLYPTDPEGKWNERNNCMFDPLLPDFDVPHVVELVEQGNIQAAYVSISLRGIGHKVKSLFLRELVLMTGSESKFRDAPESYLYCQPIDVWLRVAVDVLFPDRPPGPSVEKIELDKKDRARAWILTERALKAGVSPLKVTKESGTSRRMPSRTWRGLRRYCSSLVQHTYRKSSIGWTDFFRFVRGSGG